MAISLVGTYQSNSDQYVTLPAGCAVGDIVLVEIQSGTTKPSTTTLIAYDTNTTNRHLLVYKVLTSQDIAGTKIMTAAGAIDYFEGGPSNYRAFIACVFRGAKTPTIELAAPSSVEGGVQGTGTLLTMPLSGTTTGGMAVWMMDVYSGMNPPTPPSGWSMAGGTSGSFNVGFYKILPSGTVPSASFTMTLVSSGTSAGFWQGAVVLKDNTAPTATINNISTVDPRVSNKVSWTYSDADNNAQASAEVSIRTTGSAWATVSGTPKGNYSAIQMAYNPSVYYQLNETSGTTAVASAGVNGTYASGTVGGGTSPVPGEVTPNGGYVVRPNWTQTQAMTINCWFKCDPGELDDATSYRSLWGFGTNNWDARFNTKRSVTFHAYAANGSWYNWGLSTAADMDDGKWHMITLVWDGVNGNWKSYFDGVYNSGQSFPPQMPSMNGGNFWIGAAGGARVWAGEYAQFSVVPAALTGQNITDLYNSAKTAYALTIPANTLADEADYEVRVRVNDGSEWSNYSTDTFRSDSWTLFSEVTSSSKNATISTATLDPASDYEVQVKVYDGFSYSNWSSSGDMIFTKHYVCVNGVWVPAIKQQYWIDKWKAGKSSDF